MDEFLDFLDKLFDLLNEGSVTLRDVSIVFGSFLLMFAIFAAAWLLYSHHPQYEPVLYAALVLDGILFIAMMVWVIKLWMKVRAAQAARSAQTNQPGQ